MAAIFPESIFFNLFGIIFNNADDSIPIKKQIAITVSFSFMIPLIYNATAIENTTAINNNEAVAVFVNNPMAGTNK
ncbi:hypothetical protein TUM12370_18550 [Salmonella enterica subsp. enterica serovar Choleraesuis]|nr:hypothetical protein TUM12370_18550 [Salmonella enterica subsp. enterica serovar Choleraesuis]